MPAVPPAWRPVFDLAQPDGHTLLRAAAAAGLPVPVVGYALTGESNQVLAEAELAWEERQTAVFLPGQPEDSEIFSRNGWHTFMIEDQETLLAHLLEPA
jgi:hypothetical protein